MIRINSKYTKEDMQKFSLYFCTPEGVELIDNLFPNISGTTVMAEVHRYIDYYNRNKLRDMSDEPKKHVEELLKFFWFQR